MATMGMGVIMTAFQDASLIYTRTNGYFGSTKKTMATEALAFIQGTGLEIVIRAYRLGYDADELRNTFYRTFHVKRT